MTKQTVHKGERAASRATGARTVHPPFANSIAYAQGAACNQTSRQLLHYHVQPKLVVRSPNDLYEQEADRVADQVVRMPDPTRPQPGIDPVPIRRLSIQRLCQECEDEMQRRHDGTPAGNAGSGLDSVESTLRQPGRPLDHAARAFFEPRFGVDFSAVRIHTDSQAAASARDVNAMAYTVGRNVVFSSGRYTPHSDSGRRLLAHELTHVVQQGAHGRTVQRFVTCETGTACPTRDRGEVARSRATTHAIGDLPTPEFGIVVSNFAVNEHQVKPDLHRDLTWIRLLAHMGLAASEEWEILGFSDCEGTEARNTALRADRANELAALLPTVVRPAVRSVAAARVADCLTTNTSESERGRNRAALIRRLPGSRGPAAPAWTAGPVGPVRPPGAPAGFCVPCGSPAEAAGLRLWVETSYLNFALRVFGIEVYNLWRDYLSRPKGASLAPRVFRGSGHPIVDAFRIDPETVRHQRALYADIVAAAARTPEANIPFTGSRYRSPPIPLGTLLPGPALIRTINYLDPHIRIPGNIAGGTGVMGTASSDAGPDLRLFTGSVRIERTRPSAGAPEVRTAIIDLQLQVVDAVDFCPGAPGGTWAQAATIPMSRLEATPTEPTYDLPFHVFVDLSGSEPMP